MSMSDREFIERIRKTPIPLNSFGTVLKEAFDRLEALVKANEDWDLTLKKAFADTKRLNWLEKNGVRLLIAKIPTSEGPVAHVLSAEGWGHALWQVDVNQTCSHEKTLRKAIDAAVATVAAADKAEKDAKEGC